MLASNGIDAITAARAMSVAIISRLRSTRSTQAPMISPNNRYGRKVAAVVMARLSAEPVNLNTSKGRANWLNEVPRFEIVWPTQNFQNSPLSRAAESDIGFRSMLARRFRMPPLRQRHEDQALLEPATDRRKAAPLATTSPLRPAPPG